MEQYTYRGGVEEDGGEPWRDAHYQKNRRKPGNGVEMTFIVQNLPDRTTKTVLWKAFQSYGFVSDAYVARKKDKRGNNFGFIRFKGVENLEVTLAGMNTVKIFEAKVLVSLAKYDRNHKQFIYTSKTVGGKVWRQKENTNTDYTNSHGVHTGGATVKEGVSYASLFQKDEQVRSSGAKVISINNKGSKYPLHCINRSIHGVVKELDTLNSLNKVLSRRGIYNVGLSYVGGLSILLTIGGSGMVEEVMSNKSEVLSDVFSHYKVWEGEDLPTDRVVSLRISGIPVHLRDNSIYEQIGGLFGKIVKESTFSWSDSDNSEGSILVLVPLGKRIEETVVLNWKDRSYVIWVAEDVLAWKPSLDGDDSDMGENSDDESMDDSEENSEVEGSVDGGNMEDEVEDGEIRSPIQKSPAPVVEIRSPSEPSLQPVVDRSPEIEKLGNEELHDLHEYSPNNNKVINDDEIPEEVAAGIYDSGPNLKGISGFGLGSHDREINGTGLVDLLKNDGPSPIIGLGKRSREDRSPPSIGSMQGPPTRSFHHNPLTGEFSFDLNKSTSEHLSSGGSLAGGENSSPSEINPGDEGSGAEPTRTPEGVGDYSPDPGDAEVTIKEVEDISGTEKEVLETMKLGTSLGFNLTGAEGQVKKVILDEGGQNNLP
ncbi:putative RNA recognition motif domain, nucleotide-binding alpha-beta plait domain superfamily [Helianthus annuus]|nr:putative RNA recognition motif domain, nucleotide-binding alpha-beta plait domain superfamily [Helianthus annuus]